MCVCECPEMEQETGTLEKSPARLSNMWSADFMAQSRKADKDVWKSQKVNALSSIKLGAFFSI